MWDNPRILNLAAGALVVVAASLPAWTIVAPIAAWLLLAGKSLGLGDALGGIYVALLAAGLFGGVLAAVFHAEVVAHKIGEPYGTLVLAIAVTSIEVALIGVMPDWLLAATVPAVVPTASTAAPPRPRAVDASCRPAEPSLGASAANAVAARFSSGSFATISARAVNS